MQTENGGQQVKQIRTDITKGSLPETIGRVERFALGSFFAESLYYGLPVAGNPEASLFICDPENENRTDDDAQFFQFPLSQASNINDVRVLLKSTLDASAAGISRNVAPELIEAFNEQIAEAFKKHNKPVYSGDYRKLMRSVAHTGVFSAINGYHILHRKGITDPDTIEKFLRNTTTKRTLNSLTHTHFDIFEKVEATVTAKTKGEYWDDRFFDLDYDEHSIVESMSGAHNQSNLSVLKQMIESQTTPESQAIYCAGLYSKVTTPDGKQTNVVNAFYDWSVNWIVEWQNLRQN